MPVLSIVEGKWHFHRGDNPSWKNPELKLDGWELVQLPAWWNDHSNYNDQNCYGWYRRTIEIPKEHRGKTLVLNLGRIDDCDVTYFNGKRIGSTGRMPPRYASAWENVRLYKLPADLVKDGKNVVAVRVYNGDGKGGMYDAAAAIKPEGPFDPASPAGDGGGYLDGGIGWYRKTFDAPAGAKAKRHLDRIRRRLHGQRRLAQRQASRPAALRLHELLLRHPDAFKLAGRNVLAVRLDVQQPCSRWYSGAGIYRHVRLVAVNPVHVAHWGTYVTTPTIRADEAEVKIATRVENQGDKPAEAQLWTEVIGPDGKVVRAPRRSAQADIPAGGETTFTQTVKVPQPKLWCPDDPQLYRATSR